MEEILDKSKIGQRIRHLRIINDYTQAKFAELIDISINFLSEIENGIGSADSLLSKIVKSVTDIVSYEKSRGSRTTVSRTKTVGTCPRCGKPVIENSKWFSCSAGR